jgi:predicted membrane protein
MNLYSTEYVEELLFFLVKGVIILMVVAAVLDLISRRDDNIGRLIGITAIAAIITYRMQFGEYPVEYP